MAAWGLHMAIAQCSSSSGSYFAFEANYTLHLKSLRFDRCTKAERLHTRSSFRNRTPSASPVMSDSPEYISEASGFCVCGEERHGIGCIC